MEVGIEKNMVSQCPKATKPGQVHPHSKASRLRGNKSLQLNVMERFMTRGSGFVTGKDMSMYEVGLRDSRKYGTRTTAEYCCRLLVKGVEYMTQYEKNNTWKTINRFGKMIQEARQHLTKQLEANNDAASDLVDLYLPSICRDLGVEQQSHSRVQVLDILKRKGGQGIKTTLTYINILFWKCSLKLNHINQ